MRRWLLLRKGELIWVNFRERGGGEGVGDVSDERVTEGDASRCAGSEGEGEVETDGFERLCAE
jgi:hypothetical protein